MTTNNDSVLAYLAGYFDAKGSIYNAWTGRGRGWKHRLRITSYDRGFLEQMRSLIGQGAIWEESKTKGKYYRLEISGEANIHDFLGKLLPYLKAKRGQVDDWMREHGPHVAVYR